MRRCVVGVAVIMYSPRGIGVSEANKAVVGRLIDDVLNGGKLDLIEGLYAPELVSGARRWIEAFRAAFPNVEM